MSLLMLPEIYIFHVVTNNASMSYQIYSVLTFLISIVSNTVSFNIKNIKSVMILQNLLDNYKSI